MNEALQKLRATLLTRQGNLWEWRGVNPYDGHPLETLGLERDLQITPQRVAEAVRQLAQHERGGFRGGMSSGRARELLMTPETRVFCELLRMPPVAWPKAEIESIRRAAEESYREPPALPPIDRVTLRAEETLLRVAEAILAEEPQAEPLPRVELDDTSPPAIERQHFAGITFRQRMGKGSG